MSDELGPDEPTPVDLVWMARWGLDPGSYEHVGSCDRCRSFLRRAWTEAPLSHGVLARAADPADDTARLLDDLGLLASVDAAPERSTLEALRGAFRGKVRWITELRERIADGQATFACAFVAPSGAAFDDGPLPTAHERGVDVLVVPGDGRQVVSVTAPASSAGAAIGVVVRLDGPPGAVVAQIDLARRGELAAGEVEIDVPAGCRVVSTEVIGPASDR